MIMNKKQNLSYIFLVILLLFCCVGVHCSEPLQINSLKALALYFPSPSIMRCLNHSNIPRDKRKIDITKEIEIPKEEIIKQTIKVRLNQDDKEFIFDTNTKQGNRLLLIKIDGGPFFNVNKGGQIKPSFLFGLEDLIGIQRKIRIKDKVGNEIIDFETFLKRTRGKVGKQKYTLELFGQDRSEDGKVKYFLDGKGKIGEHEIVVTAKEIEKEQYVINETYGPVKLKTIVKVYD